MPTRDRILEAAEQVIHDVGLARATTKEIARAAGYSEATLYKNFRDKEDLFVCMLSERLPQFVPLMKDLPDRVGSGTVTENLQDVARLALDFYEETFPMAASIFSEPGLVAAQRRGVRRSGAGPRRGQEAVAAYLRAEQEIGRVTPGTDPDGAAALLLGGCFYHAFLHNFAGEQPSAREQGQLAGALVATLVGGLEKRSSDS